MKLKLEIIEYSSNVEISGIPGASTTFYIYGWDAFGNTLNSSQYSIFVDSQKATIITPEGSSGGKGGDQYYIIPFNN